MLGKKQTVKPLYKCICVIQWNLYIKDSLGVAILINREVSTFRR